MNTALFPACHCLQQSAVAVVERSGTTDEMARDEARHGKALKGLLERYFK